MTPTLPRRSPEEQTRLEATLRDVFEHKLCFNLFSSVDHAKNAAN